jgi:hemerythrin-like domain-containing protein
MLYGEVLLRREVEAQGRAMVKVLRQHMELEEGEVFPLIDSRLQEEDWAFVEERAVKIRDPLFVEPDRARFINVFKHLSTELGLS